jgi:hypothetical protein
LNHVRHGRRVSHITVAAIAMKMPTTMCDMIAAAIKSAGSHRRLPVSRVWASAPRPNSASASAIVKENSPASVLAMLPP